MELTEGLAWFLVVVLGAVAISMYVRKREATASPTTPDAKDIPGAPIEQEILERAREGIILLGPSLAPSRANAAARALLGIAPGELPPRLRSDELQSFARRALAENAAIEGEVTLWPHRLTVKVRAVSLQELGVALFLEDITQDARLQQIRRQFVVNASHELKTPVTGLLALGEAVRDALPSDVDGAQRLADQLVREAERLSKLSQDLLDLTRVEDPAALRREAVSFGQIVESETRQLKSLSEEFGVELVVEAGSDPRVNGDEQQLGLLVRNLIDNAIRYSEAGGRVRVTLTDDGEETLLSVADEGIGIPLRDQARVFERFYRVDEGRSRASGGTGLGLSIVRHVAESHGGHVSLESELGEGSVFTVRLPLTKDVG